MIGKVINIKLFIIPILLLGTPVGQSFAQWINDPATNTRLVTDPGDPVDISAIRDFSGGAFIFWQDKKGRAESDIFFLHFDRNGEVSFRSDGKTVSISSNRKENPLAVTDPSGNAIVVWKETEGRKNSVLFVQKLTRSGLRLWTNQGIDISGSRNEKLDYALKSDKYGTAYISYIVKTNQVSDRYSIRFQKINSRGKQLSDSTKGIIYNTNNTILETEVVPDNMGGAAIFWLETISSKTLLRAQYYDSTGSRKWGSEPLTVSKTKSSVINYSIGRIGSGFYAANTYHGANKVVYQQLISEKGRLLWGNEGKLLTYQKGSQTNPQFTFVDSSVIVSWTNEFEKIKDVFIQRFDIKGQRLWGSNGKRIINLKGNQFGQRIVYDQNNNVIVAWIDKRENNPTANLYIQKISLDGILIWKKEGVEISSSGNMQKSYLNLIPDEEGGAIAVFKGSYGGRNNIYGQKIFNTGTYAAQMLGFNSEITGDSVRVSWYAANEIDGTKYFIQRSSGQSGTEEAWVTIASLDPDSRKQTNYYEYCDMPDINGSVYYRVVQNNINNRNQISAPVKVDYFNNAETVLMGQNSPNPFSESTTITFYLPEEEEVTLEVFNSSIETVSKIENKKFPAGKNSYVFSADGLKPGIYFYRLKVDDFVDVKKMIITN